MSTTTAIPKFSEFVYQRPDMEAFGTDFKAAIHSFTTANNLAAAIAAIQAINRLRNDFMTHYNLAMIRHSCDTRDTFYEAENNFFDEQLPYYEQYKSSFYRALIDSPHRAALEAHYGPQLFAIAALSLKTFDPSIIEELQEENRLSSAYNKLKATAQLEFAGETYNLSSIQVKELDTDRATRRGASEVKWAWYSDHQAEIEDIFDQLVKVRHQMARKLGFDNFIALGYTRMLRTDYDAQDVAAYRSAIREYVVPVAQQLYREQAKRLGLDSLSYYDTALIFPDGNARPQGGPQWIVDQASRMYSELSDETRHFFQFMQEHELMDLISRDGKATGGYCTYIPNYQAPFIFSNFNGTSGDIDVLTHEAGHAFQVYSSRAFDTPEYNWPTYEACEIHSMSMEFFTWPWMELFFGKEVDRYRYGHLAGALYFLPYGVAVDEFQHYVYENPDDSPAQRNAAWRNLEQQYLPHLQYTGQAFLEGGGLWQKQTHIFGMPFYYIDYTLAQVCAFQFWLRDQSDHEGAWADYLRLCQAGGSAAFLQLVELAGLDSPFSAGTVARVAQATADWLAAHPVER
ncbi:MAG: M3 family oligoendopeptidase [Bacteroidetes bacterium]|nr:MAG: M3 family oligoendopeptidase [Bacteroidota bacterium]